MRASLKTSCAAALLALISLPAGAKQLCGRQVLPFDAMLAAIKSDPGTEVVRDTASFVQTDDEKRRIAWTLWRAKEHQPAAYQCLRIIEVGGHTEIHFSAECDGWTPSCQDLVGRLLSETAPP